MATWVKGDTASASTAGDWSPTGVPQNTTVKLPTDVAKPYTVTVDDGLTLNETTVTIGDDAILDVAGAGGLLATSANIAFDGTIEATAGGLVKIGSVTGEGTVYADGGKIQIGSATDDSFFAINNGGSLAFTGQVGEARHVGPAVSPQIDFIGAGTLDLTSEFPGANEFLGNIANFDSTGLNDKVEVSGSLSGGDTLNVTYAGGGADVQVVSDAANGSHVLENLVFDNVPGADHFVITASSDTSGVDIITMAPGEGGPTCFMAGTMIATPAGEVAVESLKHGDIVLAADGREVPVIWVGKQTISTRFADPLRALPIRIKAGAIDENVPARDLLVSPDHAMLVQGALIHAGAMVNGDSIVRETRVPETFVYYHVEAEDHSIILAENAPAETFVDNVDRLGFDNWAEHQALYPEGRTVEELPYPRAKSARQIPVHVRVKLAERSQAIGADVSAVA